MFLPFLTFLTFLDHLLVQGRPVFWSSSIFDLEPCLQSVGISSCLHVCCPSVSFSVDLCSFSHKPQVLAISHRCGCVLASSSGQTTLVFCFLGKFQQVVRPPPSWCLHFWCDPTWSSLLPIWPSSFRLNLVCFYHKTTYSELIFIGQRQTFTLGSLLTQCDKECKRHTTTWWLEG